MSTKGRGRGKKAAATTVEVTQENVVDSTSEEKIDEKAGAVASKDKKGSKKKPAAENGSAESSTAPTKHGRGRAKGVDTPSELDGKETPVETEIKPKRGGRRGTPVESYAEENIRTATRKRAPPKRQRVRRPPTPAKVEDSDPEPEPEPKKETKGKRGSKKEKIAITEEEEEGEQESQVPEAASNWDLPEEENSKGATPAEEEEAKDSQPSKPAKRDRGKKAAPVAEERTPNKSKEKSINVNSKATNYAKIEFSLDKEFNLKISSWSIDGLRTWIRSGCKEYITHEKPDIVCLQEIKWTPDQISDNARIPEYHPYWLCKPDGYAGVAIYSRKMPLNVEYGIGDEEQDESGHVITAEYLEF